ncbi:hypothetical protein CRG98_039714 [Punica granatum]|uniref:Uncharacterized protein n=1 Tax=Punica granatum TaxID=22663 RepID=A0A2I0I797_PUNGR|nr:hypothetical protein CRG98_039714 [Punica granatum]
MEAAAPSNLQYFRNKQRWQELHEDPESSHSRVLLPRSKDPWGGYRAIVRTSQQRRLPNWVIYHGLVIAANEYTLGVTEI